MHSEGGPEGLDPAKTEEPKRSTPLDAIQKLSDEQRLKNERTRNGVCKAFLHAECKREACPHIHDKKRAEPCKNFDGQGSCLKGDKCDFRHEQDQFDPTKPCRSFKISGTCNQGDKCPYKHKRTICKDYDRGFCIDGPRCKNHHEERAACPNYLLGFCPKGPDCANAHPKLFFDFDEQFFEKMEPDMKILKCHRCNMIGHKAPECEREKDFGNPSPNPMRGTLSNPMGGPTPPSLVPGFRGPGQFGIGFQTMRPVPPPPPTPPPRPPTTNPGLN